MKTFLFALKVSVSIVFFIPIFLFFFCRVLITEIYYNIFPQQNIIDRFHEIRFGGRVKSIFDKIGDD
jgi:hypothetical protein